MGWFKSKGSKEERRVVAENSRVEVIAHKNATKEVVRQAQDANKHLKQLLDENGFTLKIYLAAGGKQHKTRRQKA